MRNAEQGRVRDAVQVIAAVALVALGAYVAKLALDDRDSHGIVLAVAGAACLFGILGLVMWWLERRAGAGVRAAVAAA
ncbi:MAG: hypothetical protein QOJ13_3150, partial [Gaiellales bacterium]|nr:hypothetical protein [Gaiellales bacterium]